MADLPGVLNFTARTLEDLLRNMRHMAMVAHVGYFMVTSIVPIAEVEGSSETACVSFLFDSLVMARMLMAIAC